MAFLLLFSSWDEFDTILEDEDGVLYVTEGIADDFASDHETNIIRKDGDT